MKTLTELGREPCIKNMFLLIKDSCVMKYCQDGIEVYYVREKQMYTYPDQTIYGHYEFQNDVNGRPYFKKNDKEYCFNDNELCGHGIWWSNGYWLIGWNDWKGKPVGLSYYASDIFCPHNLKMRSRGWKVLESTGWRTAHKDLHINCKYLNTNSL